ncbi:hypothetical protein CANINC_001028 [Pichia inconspicua]|uniref:E3 ubiquitin-protein ligase n=1 Tax=Pichia inconspicua TaxID=52247 RepID=A0A4T0X6C7_9ASCO|nr:hypothetical protein CANINC_001028 [[Candida] inconspicua]
MSISGIDSSSDYARTKLAKDLFNQFHMIPKMWAYEHKIEIITFKSLSFALSNYGKYFNFFLHDGGFHCSYPSTWDEVNDVSFNKYFYLDQENSTINSHHNHICAFAIPPGQNVYNCYDCGVDPTCCLCESCFNKDEHSDHNVSVHKSSGDAICDCGDSVSWKLNLNCLANEKDLILKSKLKPLPNDLKSNINILLRILFDFIIDVQLTNIYTLPLNFPNDTIKSNIYSTFQSLQNTHPFDENIKTYNWPIQKFDGDYKDYDVLYTGTMEDYYYLIVWNDEFHNFDQAINFLSAAHVHTDDFDSDDFVYFENNYNGLSDFQIDGDMVENMAKLIDEKGYICYARSKDLSILKSKCSKFDSISTGISDNLQYSIINGKTYGNQILVNSIFNWLEFILKNKNTLLTDYIKNEMTNVLFEKAQPYLKELQQFDDLIKLTNDGNLNTFLTSSSLKIPILKDSSNLSNLKVNQLGLGKDFDSTIVDENEIEDISRLQYLTFFEMRFPKSIRKLIKKIILPSISNTTHTRWIFAKQILKYLPTFEFNTTYYDREWHLSFLETFRLQVYHDPNVGTKLLMDNSFKNIIESLLINLRSSSLLKNGKYFANKSLEWKIRRQTTSIVKSIEGLKTIVKFIHKGTTALFDDHIIVNFLRFFTIYEELYPLIRKTDIHEESEDRISCGLYHSALIPIESIAESFGIVCNGFFFKSDKVEKSIALISSYLKLKPRQFKNNQIINFDVTKDGISMCHPIGLLLSNITRNYKSFQSNLLLDSVSNVSFDLKSGFKYEIDESSNLTNFTGVADEMIQPWVFHVQILSNFWIRNGIYVVYAEKYFELYKPENFLFLIQQGIILNQLPIENIIDRFMLTDCIEHNESFENHIYEEKMPLILKEFMQMMYYLFTLRIYYDSSLSSDDVTKLTDEAILACILAPHPLKYSELEESYNCANFEEIIGKISNYLPPTNYNDYGRYIIKPEYIEKIDPFSYSTANLIEIDVEEAVINAIAESKGKKPEDVVITPYIYPLDGKDLLKFKEISEYFKSAKFVKLLYKLLSYAVMTDNDTHLNITLQLIHAIIIDDQQYHKSDDNHGLKHFVEIPICNLLLSAAEKSDLPKNVSKKASTILELLLLKDDDVLTSLMDCFGSKHIDDYKKSKLGKGLSTKTERKRKQALKRQQKVINKMKKQQLQFVDNNKEYFSEGDSNEITNKSKTEKSQMNEFSDESRSCIICKKPSSNDSIFGTPAFVSTSSVFWNIPTIGDKPPSFMVESFNRKVAKNSVKQQNSSKIAYCCREKMVIDGCPHGMHMNCFQDMLGQKRMTIHDYLCPLCKGKANTFVPSFKTREFEVDPINFEKINYSFEQISTIYGDNMASLSTQLFDKNMFKILSNPDSSEYKSISQQLKMLNVLNRYANVVVPVNINDEDAYEKLDECVYSQFLPSLLIGSTLEMREIISRDKIDDFEIPEIVNATLKSLLQFRTLVNYTSNENTEDQLAQYKFMINNSNIGFTETIMLLFMESSMPLIDCIKFSFMKRIFYICVSLLERSNENENNLDLDCLLDDVKPLNEKSIVFKAMQNVLEKALISLAKYRSEISKLTNNIIQLAYKLISTNYKNWMRQIKFISKFLNTIPISSSLIQSVDEILTESINANSDAYKFLNYLSDESSVSVKFTETQLHKRDGYFGFIEYPKPIHLVDLPKQLKELAKISASKRQKYYIHDELFERPTEKFRDYDHLCLHCGKWLSKILPHRSKCQLSSYATLIFTPVKNQLMLCISPLVAHDSFPVESPYLNKHGEPAKGILGLGDSGTLNMERYKHLQEAYYNQTMIRNFLRNKPPLGGLHEVINMNVIPGILEPEEYLRRLRESRVRRFGGNNAIFIPNDGLFNFTTTGFTNFMDFGNDDIFDVDNDDDDDDDNDVNSFEIDFSNGEESEYFEDGDEGNGQFNNNPFIDLFIRGMNAAARNRDNSLENDEGIDEDGNPDRDALNFYHQFGNGTGDNEETQEFDHNELRRFFPQNPDDNDGRSCKSASIMYSSIYNLIFKRNSTFVASIFATTFVFQVYLDEAVTSWYEARNKGKLWADLKPKVLAGFEETEDDE